MSLHSGTTYETEFKRLLEQAGYYVLNLGQNESGDLISFAPDGTFTVYEIKSQMNGQMRFDFDSPKLRQQWNNLSVTANYVNVEYAFRTKGKQWRFRNVGANEPCPKSIRIDLLPSYDYDEPDPEKPSGRILEGRTTIEEMQQWAAYECDGSGKRIGE